MRKMIYFFMATLVLCAGTANARSNHHVNSRLQPTHVNNIKVNLNTANVKQLSSLKGIGVKKAEAIIAYRKQKGNFKSLNDLQGVKGIGAQFIQRLLKNNPGKIINKSS